MESRDAPARDEPATATAAARPERSSIVPPYWQRHERNASRQSSYSVEARDPIRLEDHTDEGSEQCKALWAKHVTIDDYVVVGSGTTPALGAYVVWNITVDTLNVSAVVAPSSSPCCLGHSTDPSFDQGSPMKIIKRYSDFDDLRQKLVQTFPHLVGAMPPLPPKSIVSRFRSKFLEKRRVGLAHFLNCILLNPEFAGSPVLKEFLFE
ncbi:Phox-like protein [Paraphaeosphaeria sporulosa]|uniref:Endosomal/vacuolar adapter protein YPT35 n=1 Tax=Paraphaeosphaeria sporulosa TaxID=1460663 RepID=A0A177CME4_9PLEO|nr:Phox-like protein [Paraphaeosphaeria sporulosa]OAG08683.1 Phox-like protein [Paraphaeosphaeria sporulosa]